MIAGVFEFPEIMAREVMTPRRDIKAMEVDSSLDEVMKFLIEEGHSRIPIYEEELVIIATAGHPPIKSPRDARSQTVLAFEAGCSYRQRLEDWFAHHGEMPERIVEITSYHAMLGCAVAGMGISLMPRNVLSTFPDAKLLSVHSLPPALARSQTSLIWRRGVLSPKVRALIEVLTEHSGQDDKQRARRKNGRLDHAFGNGRSRVARG